MDLLPSRSSSSVQRRGAASEPARGESAPSDAARREPARPPAPSLPDWVFAAACAAALLPVTVVELVGAARVPQDAAWLWVTIGLFAVLHLIVAVRRWSPRGALVAASVVMLLLTAASLPGTPAIAVLLPSSVAYLPLVFTAAASRDRWADAAALVLGLLGAALMTVVSIAHGPVPEPGVVIALAGFLVASIGAAWALGRYQRESRRRREAVALGARQAAEIRLQAERAAVTDERRRIGRELHDVISHSLAVMVAQAEASRVLLDRDAERARTAIEHVVATGRAAMTDMRGLLSVLADSAAATEGAPSAPAREPSPALEDLRELVEHAAAPGRVVDLAETGTPVAVSPGTALTAYRVVQESLTNTLKHTEPPTRSEVRLEWDAGELVVTVVDDGSRPTGAVNPEPGGGIRGMRDRVEQAGGWLESGPADSGGWRVRAHFPLAAEASRE